MQVEISPLGVAETLRKRLLRKDGNAVDEPLLGAMVRHVADVLCPCPETQLRRKLAELLTPLCPEGDAPERVEQTIDQLQIAGDLFEAQSADESQDEPTTRIHLSPPSFFTTPSGRAYMFGAAPEGAEFLPNSIMNRVQYARFARFIDPQPGENLAAIMRESELRQVKIAEWVRVPAQEEASDLVDGVVERLQRQGAIGHIPDLKILGPGSAYGRRWCEAEGLSGFYVARRPRAYGAPLWGVVQLDEGRTVRFLDFPFPESRQRGCDVAWRLQLALDHRARSPQTYSCNLAGDFFEVRLSFPIPLWARRRLSILAAQDERYGAPIWRIPEREWPAERDILESRLFFVAQGGVQ